MTMALDVRRDRTRSFSGGGESTGSTTISMTTYVERTKPILRYSAVAQVDEAVTDQGVSLAPEKPEDPRITTYSRATLPFSVTLKSAPEETILRSLKGKIWLIVEENAEYWTINNPESGGIETKNIAEGAETMTYEGKKESQGREFSLMMEGIFAKGQSPALLISPDGILDRIEALDSNEKRVFKLSRRSRVSSNRTQPGGDILSKMTINFLATPAKGSENAAVAKIRIRIPSEARAIAVPFEFKGLELP